MKTKVAVVFESMFGNTRVIAEAIAEGLRETGEVTFGNVDEVAPEDVRDAALVVSGGPTHNYGIARPDARRSLSRARFGRVQAPLLPGQESLRGWLERLPAGHALAAAFDTRYDRPRLLTGSAAVKIGRVFHGKGYTVIGTVSFFVGGAGGPLVPGERERAVAWGRELAEGARGRVTDTLRAAR